jgi:hypothetical protein
VKRNANRIEGHKDINLVLRGSYLSVRESHLIEVVAASDSRFKVLMGKYVITGMRKDPGEGIAYCLNALTGLTTYFYRVVQMRLLMLSI